MNLSIQNSGQTAVDSTTNSQTSNLKSSSADPGLDHQLHVGALDDTRTPPRSARRPANSPAISPSVRIVLTPCARRWKQAPTRSTPTPSPPPCSRICSGAEREAASHLHRCPRLGELDALLASISEAMDALVTWDVTAFQSVVERQREICERLAHQSEWRALPGHSRHCAPSAGSQPHV